MQKALALMMTGDKVSAEEAEKLNMIYKVVEDEVFEEEITKFATNLATMPTRGLGLTKKAVNLGLFNSLEDQLDVEERLQTEAGETDDFAEGVNAFLQKRAPIFKGK
jgi:2-(1,2-epoxy-1,2-dihydrophenyl)acetyl-CoA isomerase